MSTAAATGFSSLPLSDEKAPCPSLATVSSPLSMEASDEALLALIAANDSEALGILFRRYARIILRIGRRILRDDAEAEDLVQDVFLYIHRKRGVYDPAKGRASSWIIQTVYYQALQRRMRLTASRNRLTDAVQDDSGATRVGPAVGRDHFAELVFGRSAWQGILKTLTEEQWETLRMHFFEGYTLREIAEKRGQSVGNTRHHFYRGLEALRKQVFADELSRRAKNSGK